MTGGNKFMVNLLGAVSSKHLFGLAWMAITGFFVLLMVMSYRRSVRRNFRGQNDRRPLPGGVTPRRLGGTDGPSIVENKKLGKD